MLSPAAPTVLSTLTSGDFASNYDERICQTVTYTLTTPTLHNQDFTSPYGTFFNRST